MAAEPHSPTPAQPGALSERHPPSQEPAGQEPLTLLRALEWAFLLFTILAASYAFALQRPVETLSWYLIYLTALGLFILRYGTFLSALWLMGPLLLWPVLAATSYFWSDTPNQTLRATIQLTMTVLIAAYLGGRFSLFDICRGLFWVMLACALVSLLAILAKLGFAYDHNGIARGIFPHKNVLGGRMVLLLICSILLFAIGWKRPLVLLAATLCLLLTGFSRSATSIVMMFGLCAIAPVLLTWRSPGPLRLLAYLLAAMVGASAAWFVLSYGIDPAGLALDALGKERTLTGRSVLWDFATGMIAQRPVLGLGYNAFWDGNDGSLSSYIQYVMQQNLKNFHNSYLDITVQMGFVGLFLTLASGVWFGVAAMRVLRYGSDATAALPIFFLAFVTVYSLSEYALFRQHSLIQILLGALFVASLRYGASARDSMLESTLSALGKGGARLPQTTGWRHN
ncbi:O-antigen ligase family protein [Pelagibius sp.]|uniref:O-antigen ligase family protein n=1 Tax=Pelagibius sp. TaxID=1931238 RepID=UPI003B5010FE